MVNTQSNQVFNNSTLNPYFKYSPTRFLITPKEKKDKKKRRAKIIKNKSKDQSAYVNLALKKALCNVKPIEAFFSASRMLHICIYVRINYSRMRTRAFYEGINPFFNPHNGSFEWKRRKKDQQNFARIRFINKRFFNHKIKTHADEILLCNSTDKCNYFLFHFSPPSSPNPLISLDILKTYFRKSFVKFNPFENSFSLQFSTLKISIVNLLLFAR